VRCLKAVAAKWATTGKHVTSNAVVVLENDGSGGMTSNDVSFLRSVFGMKPREWATAEKYVTSA
jgi:hypothetical protein